MVRRIRERDRTVQLQVYDDGTGAYRRPSSLLKRLRRDGLQGCNSATKFVPEGVFSADDEGALTFLAAYWDCDGHVSPNFAYAKTISSRLARDLQDLLLRVGVASRVSSYAQADCRDGRAYQVHVYDRYDRVGGLMIYGIPNFKLPKKVVFDRWGDIEAAGVEFRPDTFIGIDKTMSLYN